MTLHACGSLVSHFSALPVSKLSKNTSGNPCNSRGGGFPSWVTSVDGAGSFEGSAASNSLTRAIKPQTAIFECVRIRIVSFRDRGIGRRLDHGGRLDHLWRLDRSRLNQPVAILIQ